MKRGAKRRTDRPVGALAATAILHVLVLVLLANVLHVPVLNLFRAPPREREPQRVTFLTPRAPEPQPVVVVPPVAAKQPERAPTDTGAAVAQVATVTPPAVIPSGIAAVRGDSTRADSIAGRAGSPVAGLLPIKPDGRLIGPVGPPAVPDVPMRAPRFSTDSAVATWVTAYWDSVARAQRNAPKPNVDWTVKRGGDKYGIDPAFIYFGKFKLPTALLALLPINTMANPTVAERNRALDYMRRDIMFHASRATSSEDFDAAVRRIRERVERERAERIRVEEAKKPAGGSGTGSRPPGR